VLISWDYQWVFEKTIRDVHTDKGVMTASFIVLKQWKHLMYNNWGSIIKTRHCTGTGNHVAEEQLMIWWNIYNRLKKQESKPCVQHGPKIIRLGVQWEKMGKKMITVIIPAELGSYFPH
jgi:hypothetical protein